MNIYITGDTHGNEANGFNKLSSKIFLEGRNLTKNDIMIIAGDAGIVWDGSKTDLFWQKWLAGKKYQTVFIDGNHENHSLLNNYPIEPWFGGKVRNVNGVLLLMRGEIFTLSNGITLLTIGGAKSHDTAFRTKGKSFWPELEQPSEEEQKYTLNNIEKFSWNVDIVVTHTCPARCLQYLSMLNGQYYKPSETELFLDKIAEKLKFKQWYFGHFHIDTYLPNGFIPLYRTIKKVKLSDNID